MNQSNPDVTYSAFCPDCGIGSIKIRKRPFLKLYYGQLFTIPNALCYVCDVCNYTEFDNMSFDLISDMIHHAKKKQTNSNDQPSMQSADDHVSKRQTPSF